MASETIKSLILSKRKMDPAIRECLLALVDYRTLPVIGPKVNRDAVECIRAIETLVPHETVEEPEVLAPIEISAPPLEEVEEPVTSTEEVLSVTSSEGIEVSVIEEVSAPSLHEIPVEEVSTPRTVAPSEEPVVFTEETPTEEVLSVTTSSEGTIEEVSETSAPEEPVTSSEESVVFTEEPPVEPGPVAPPVVFTEETPIEVSTTEEVLSVTTSSEGTIEEVSETSAPEEPVTSSEEPVVFTEETPVEPDTSSEVPIENSTEEVIPNEKTEEPMIVVLAAPEQRQITSKWGKKKL
jgi:hypothetical protein